MNIEDSKEFVNHDRNFLFYYAVLYIIIKEQYNVLWVYDVYDIMNYDSCKFFYCSCLND